MDLPEDGIALVNNPDFQLNSEFTVNVTGVVVEIFRFSLNGMILVSVLRSDDSVGSPANLFVLFWSRNITYLGYRFRESRPVLLLLHWLLSPLPRQLNFVSFTKKKSILLFT